MPKLVEAYNGVTPASAALSPLPPPNLATWGAKLIWQGFRMTDGGSQVFFQVAGPIEYELKPGKTHLVVKFRNTKVHLKNNARELETRFFATPVRRVTTRKMRKDVEVHIGLKEAAEGTARIDVGPEGTQFLVIDFPPGKADARVAASGAEPGAEGEGDGDAEGAPRASRASGPRAPAYSNAPGVPSTMAVPEQEPASPQAAAPAEPAQAPKTKANKTAPSSTLPPPLSP